MINGLDPEHQSFTYIVHLDDYSFSVKKCGNIVYFLKLTKRDFSKEYSIKGRIFGKSFENIDCLSLTQCYAHAITLGQTFNDDFVFVGKVEDEIPIGRSSKKVREINMIIPPVNY